MKAISFGIVGAGPWVRRFHAPLIATGPETRLQAIWARRPEAAAQIAAEYGCEVASSFEELLETCDAIDFAVRPDVQASLAPIAARAGKPLLIEKPIGLTLVDARLLADALVESRIPHMLMLTNRFSARTEAFIQQARSVDPVGGVAVALNGAILPDGPFATPWRIEYGALKDNGPHMFDLLTECLGPITTVSASGDPTRWVSVTTVHEGGARGSLAISLAVGVSTHVHRCEIYGPRGSAVTAEHFDHDPRGETAANIRRAIAEVIERGEPHRLDVRRGLYLQECIDAAERSIMTGGAPAPRIVSDRSTEGV